MINVVNFLKSKQKEIFLIPAIFFFLTYFGFFWIYKLDEFPGLHADEAWSGLKAFHFMDKHVDQLTGMNNYTGILEALLSKLVFTLFGPGVAQLRISGAILNLIGLLIAAHTLFVKKSYRTTAIFLLIIGQSTLFMISPRIAWEVNSFTLFFMSLLFISFIKITNRNSNKRGLWIFLFLFINALGTYNHIIFSSISFSAFIGVLLWTAYFKSNEQIQILILLFINMCNLVIVFLVMRYVSGSINVAYIYIGIVALLATSTLVYHKIILTDLSYNIRINVPIKFIQFLLILFSGLFIFFHGIAFFQIIAGYLFILQVYSYECSALVQTAGAIIGIIFIGHLIRFLLKDLQHKNQAKFSFFIFAYFGVLCLYTTSVSFRYYLALYLIIAIYMAYKIGNHLPTKSFILAPLGLSLIMINTILLDIFTSSNRPVKAIEFKIGNKQIETTAHFLPKLPIINFLKIHKTLEIQYLCEDPYFLKEPILFYRVINPWPQVKGQKTIIDYNFNSYESGFNLYEGKP
ncbi:hypothetical protein HQN86_01420 [Pedobacter panaciterrae]|uniref:hypothetical protein n=1 Tax=Pedobacter panaciterrae TaxID=363849 RepID=UPI00155D8DAD|nr:hypothetical protein [Pedobacter panaciterrae]NQX52263.1 hypothetical protein [Pedobacter panaciterrae]